MDKTVATAKAKPAGIDASSILLTLLRARTLVALAVLLMVFSYLSPTFFTPASLLITTEHVATNAFLAIGITFVILTGGIDLSVGSILGLTGMIAGALINEGLVLPTFGVRVYFVIWVIVLMVLAAGVLMGAVNGLIITRLGVAPFIATLGMLYVARGLALLSNNGSTFPNLVGVADLNNTGFTWIGTGRLAGVPVPILLMLVLAFVAWFITERTPFGRQVYAIGGNERAAELSGIRVRRIKMLVYMISLFCAAIGGLVVAAQLIAAHPASGTTFELNAIAAAVLGGTSLSGGRGSVLGTLVGAFVIGVLGDGLVNLGVSEFWQTVIKGLVIVGAVAIDQFQARLQQRVALQKQRR
ncbi:MAG: ABC transporter permease [Anaerolineae bacterium]|nr:ABC transporter permease [Anaerolineae bacterium]